MDQNCKLWTSSISPLTLDFERLFKYQNLKNLWIHKLWKDLHAIGYSPLTLWACPRVQFVPILDRKNVFLKLIVEEF